MGQPPLEATHAVKLLRTKGLPKALCACGSVPVPRASARDLTASFNNAIKGVGCCVQHQSNAVVLRAWHTHSRPRASHLREEGPQVEADVSHITVSCHAI